MFDINLEFSPQFLPSAAKGVDTLVITSCTVHYFSDKRLWSEFEEVSFNNLNSNNYGLGVLDFEIGVTGYTGKSYPKVYTKCFRLVTDNKQIVKPLKISNDASFSKINMNGELVFGLRYYFTSEEQVERLLDCKSLLIEMFVALDKPTNTYGIACQMSRKNQSDWHCDLANTYRIHERANNKGLLD